MLSFLNVRMLLTAVGVALVIALAAAGLTLSARTFILDRALDEELAPADVAVVLGAAVQTRGRPNACLAARVRRAADLYHRGLTRNLVVTGGDDRGTGLNEAEHMARWLAEQGVPEAAIVQEPRASSTAENIAFSAPILAERGWQSVLLVSDPYHLPRAAALARRQGWEVYPAPAVESLCWRLPGPSSYYTWRETALVLRDLTFSELFGRG